jgi:transcription factor TGA
MEYGHWVEEQNRQTCDLRHALNAHIGDTELQMLVTDGLAHYFQLFRIKATATKADVFYVMSGMWKTSAERFFLWIGGFRPSELLKVWEPCISQFIGTTWSEAIVLMCICFLAAVVFLSGNCRIQVQF